MQLGLHLADFTFPGGASSLGRELAKVVALAEEVGFDKLTVMDHVWQIGVVGPPEHEMLEAYTTLGFIAGHTTRVELMTLVTGVVYRSPGLLAKIVTTLDVLSGGRGALGIGAAWNAEESAGLGLFFPPLAERFERLEETLEICLAMWAENEQAYGGRHFDLGRTLNSPQSITRPHPPILIGGSGEKKTLRLVARYAQACNLFAGPELAHKLAVLAEHCSAVGRDYDEITKTVGYRFDVGAHGENAQRTIDELGVLRELGFTVAYGMIPAPRLRAELEQLGELVIPAVHAL